MGSRSPEELNDLVRADDRDSDPYLFGRNGYSRNTPACHGYHVAAPSGKLSQIRSRRRLRSGLPLFALAARRSDSMLPISLINGLILNSL